VGVVLIFYFKFKNIKKKKCFLKKGPHFFLCLKMPRFVANQI